MVVGGGGGGGTKTKNKRRKNLVLVATNKIYFKVVYIKSLII
jgi:hypothetical protein